MGSARAQRDENGTVGRAGQMSDAAMAWHSLELMAVARAVYEELVPVRWCKQHYVLRADNLQHMR